MSIVSLIEIVELFQIYSVIVEILLAYMANSWFVTWMLEKAGFGVDFCKNSLRGEAHFYLTVKINVVLKKSNTLTKKHYLVYTMTWRNHCHILF